MPKLILPKHSLPVVSFSVLFSTFFLLSRSLVRCMKGIYRRRSCTLINKYDGEHFKLYSKYVVGAFVNGLKALFSNSQNNHTAEWASLQPIIIIIFMLGIRVRGSDRERIHRMRERARANAKKAGARRLTPSWSSYEVRYLKRFLSRFLRLFLSIIIFSLAFFGIEKTGGMFVEKRKFSWIFNMYETGNHWAYLFSILVTHTHSPTKRAKTTNKTHTHNNCFDNSC